MVHAAETQKPSFEDIGAGGNVLELRSYGDLRIRRRLIRQVYSPLLIWRFVPGFSVRCEAPGPDWVHLPGKGNGGTCSHGWKTEEAPGVSVDEFPTYGDPGGSGRSGTGFVRRIAGFNDTSITLETKTIVAYSGAVAFGYAEPAASAIPLVGSARYAWERAPFGDAWRLCPCDHAGFEYVCAVFQWLV